MLIEKDVAAERHLLTNLAQNGEEIYNDICDIISTDCFSGDNSLIYQVLQNGLQNSKKIDINI